MLSLFLFLVTGTFARIYNGVLTGPGEGQQQQSVLVKTVSGMASADQVNLLLIESSMLKDLTHRNLLPVMAVCLEDEKQPLVMFPFMNRGNLKLFIKKSRSPEGGSKVRLIFVRSHWRFSSLGDITWLITSKFLSSMGIGNYILLHVTVTHATAVVPALVERNTTWWDGLIARSRTCGHLKLLIFRIENHFPREGMVWIIVARPLFSIVPIDWKPATG